MAELERAEDRVAGPTDEVPSFMRVESTTLEPIVCTQSFARFQLEPQGILSKDTCLQFRINTSAAASDKMFLNVSTGISALIRTCTLKIGGKVINQIQDVPFYHAMTKAYNSPSYRTGIDKHLHGIQTVVSQNTAVTTEAGTYTLRDVKPDSPTQASIPYSMLLKDAGGPYYAIWLRELCPILNDIELPLFLLEKAGDITIELVFNQQTSTATGASVGNIGGDVASNGLGTLAQPVATANVRADIDTSCTLDINSVKMFIDRLYYESDRMAAVAERLNATQGRMLNFVDVVSTTASMPNSAFTGASAPPAGQIRVQTLTNQIAVSGMRVQNLKWCYTVNDYTTQKAGGATSLTPRHSRDFTGRYAMLATQKDDAYNLRINDQLFYNTDVENPAYKASELESIYAAPVALFTGLYSHNAMTNKEGAFTTKTHLFPATAAYSLAGGLELRQLEGAMHFAGANLSVAYGNASDDSVLIGQKPIEVIHRFPRSEDDNFNYVARYYVETVKRFAMRDGLVEVFT